MSKNLFLNVLKSHNLNYNLNKRVENKPVKFFGIYIKYMI